MYISIVFCRPIMDDDSIDCIDDSMDRIDKPTSSPSGERQHARLASAVTFILAMNSLERVVP